MGTHTIKARVTDNDEMVSEELEQEVNIVQPEMIEISGKQIPIATCKDGLYKVEHNDLKELDKSWNKTEYRYAGAYPDNYVEFNNEKWQIIGLVNVKTKTGVEQRLKIIKTETEDEIAEYYAWDRDRNYTNNWTTSKLKDMLNGIYYNSESGKCYPGIEIECDFSGSGILQKGLDDTARKMIDSEVIWNLGGWNTTEITADIMYEKERGTNTGSSNAYPAEWTKENDGEYHNGIGLMYASDYGYAVGGKVRNVCLNYTLENYRIDCTNNWLNPVILVGEDQNGYSWFLTPDSSSSKDTFKVDSYGNIWSVNTSYTNGVRPVGFLLPSVIINDGDGSYDNPYLLSVQ